MALWNVRVTLPDPRSTEPAPRAPRTARDDAPAPPAEALPLSPTRSVRWAGAAHDAHAPAARARAPEQKRSHVLTAVPRRRAARPLAQRRRPA
ncbi:hypothetical protein GCM10023324_22740 [Streptomyces youssoufiensis]